MKYILIIVSLLYFSNIYGQSTVVVNSDQTISINGSKFFPISVYVQSDYAGIKNMGVNTASRPFCVNIDAFNQIVAQQLYCHYTAGSGCGDDNATDIKNRNSSGFTSSINQVKNSNYLFGYGLPDEAKTSEGLSATDTQWAYNVIKTADPNHPVFFTEYSSDISAYKNSADIFLNDEYPFNNDVNPLYDIKTKIKNMQSQVAPKPVWPIIQTGSQFGVPTNAQIRAETYLSIALGSTGIIFYSYDVDDAGGIHNIKTDGDPAFMKNLITELKSFSPYFLGSKNVNLTYTSSDIDAILKDYNGKSYLIAINKSTTSKSISFTLGGFGNATATILGLSSAGSSRTGQTRTVSSGSMSDTLQGLEAVVYQISSTTCTVPGQPGSITGNTNITASSSNTYSISPVSGATSYTWTLPSGWSGSSTSTSITATAGSTGGTITVKANNTCGAGSASSLAVTVGTGGSGWTTNYYYFQDALTSDYARPTDGSTTANVTQFVSATLPSYGSTMWSFVNAPTTGYYHIVNRSTGKAMRPLNGSTADGAAISQYTLDATSATYSSMQWSIEASTTETGTYWLKNRASGKYLRPQDGADGNGVAIVQNTLNAAYSSFSWHLISAGTKIGRVAQESPSKASVNIYPNPAATVLNLVELKGSSSLVEIISLDGSVVYKTTINGSTGSINVADIKGRGLVLVRVTNEEGTTLSKIKLE